MIVTVVDTPAPVAVASTVIQPLPPGWTHDWPPPEAVTVDLGAVVRARPAHVGSKAAVLDLYPVIEIGVGDRLQISADDGITYEAWKGRTLSFGPVIEYRETFRDRLPKGAPFLPDAIEAGGFAFWKTPGGDVQARLRRALTNYQGWSGNVAFDTGGYVTPRFGIGVEVRAQWVEANYARHFFDVHPQHEAIFSWPRFGPGDYDTGGAQVTGGYRLTPRLTVFTQASLDRIIGDQWRPPVLNTRNLAMLTTGLTWRFGRIVPYGHFEDRP